MSNHAETLAAPTESTHLDIMKHKSVAHNSNRKASIVSLDFKSVGSIQEAVNNNNINKPVELSTEKKQQKDKK